jgi:cell division protein FtsB
MSKEQYEKMNAFFTSGFRLYIGVTLGFMAWFGKDAYNKLDHLSQEIWEGKNQQSQITGRVDRIEKDIDDHASWLKNHGERLNNVERDVFRHRVNPQ